jgi:hypothetical protein
VRRLTRPISSSAATGSPRLVRHHSAIDAPMIGS